MQLRDRAKQVLARGGLQLRRLSAADRAALRGYDDRTPLPPDAERLLRPDNPRLLELTRRYAQCRTPLADHTQWTAELASDATDLQRFRGDNAYLWQYGRSAELNELRMFVYARYVQQQAGDELWSRVREDGAFGCFTFDYSGMPTVSRDLLDSVNELAFLDEHVGLTTRSGLRVVDIGAGYGRLAHRMHESVPGLERYWCLDAVPRSTFLSEFYLAQRGVRPAVVVALDDVAEAVPAGSVDLAVNVHSFSEMSRAAIGAWLQWLVAREVPTLFLVPNEREQLLSREADGTRRDCADLLAEAGFRLAASRQTITDPGVRDLLGIHDVFLLYARG